MHSHMDTHDHSHVLSLILSLSISQTVTKKETDWRTNLFIIPVGKTQAAHDSTRQCPPISSQAGSGRNTLWHSKTTTQVAHLDSNGLPFCL